MTDAIEWRGIEGIVLDAVGTLIEPVPSVAFAYARAARTQGVVIDEQLVRRRFGLSFSADEVDEARGPLATDESTELRRWRRIVSQVLPEVADPDRAFDDLWTHFSLPGSWRLFDDAFPALELFQEAGIPLVIASNFDGRLRGVLTGLPGLESWVDRLVISSEVGFRKPHPEFYHEAVKNLGRPPAVVLSAGDDLENDVRGPIRAGLRGVLIDRKGRSSDPKALRDLRELAIKVVEARNPG